MALFPKADFKVFVDEGRIVAGEKLSGMLVLEAKEDIPRADHVDLVFRSMAWAGYGSGKSRSVVRRQMFLAPLRLDLPKGVPFPKGEHRFPFTLDIPAWLPPGLAGPDCGIVHEIEARLDVDWAIDPVTKLAPRVVRPPMEGFREPHGTRSPPGFHDTMVLEVTVASTTIAEDEPLHGEIALRSGREARFDAVVLSMRSSVMVPMGRGDRRLGAGTAIRIPSEMLRAGEPVAFTFPPNPHLPPSYTTGFLDHFVVLEVSADIPWAIDPSFEVGLRVLPRGSSIVGHAVTAPVGSARLRRHAAAMAQATGLSIAEPPGLVEGRVGPVSVRLEDAAQGGRLGLGASLVFPDLELGITFRELGVLEGFRDSPLLPEKSRIRDRHLLRCDPTDARPPVPDEVLRSFFAAILAGLDGADDVRLADHHLGVHFPLPNDESPRMIEAAAFMQARAAEVARQIGLLPFPAPVAHARPAWEAMAAEQSAFLVPTGPSLHGLVLRARVLSGEERAITASIRTVWSKTGPALHVEVDLRSSPLPAAAWAALTSATPNELLRAVRTSFPVVEPLAGGAGVTLERQWTPDPHELLSPIATFFDWVLDFRGERRVDSPYR
ncbi:MAG: hypothetical protein JST00_23190 [Deltaproteobacteria bacterium]|nr:hypothetical protein [Deltaproteobacteria bacterium]